jgi:hypothetical protein
MRFYFVSTYEIERTNFSNGLLRQGTLLQKHSFLFFQVASPRLLSFSFKSRLAFSVRLWLTPAVLMPLRLTNSPPAPAAGRGGGGDARGSKIYIEFLKRDIATLFFSFFSYSASCSRKHSIWQFSNRGPLKDVDVRVRNMFFEHQIIRE